MYPWVYVAILLQRDGAATGQIELARNPAVGGHREGGNMCWMEVRAGVKPGILGKPGTWNWVVDLSLEQDRGNKQMLLDFG